MKPHTPLLGYNNNIPHKGKMYHVQTEDQGLGRAQIATHLFADGGRVVHSTKTSYSEHLEAEDLGDRIREMMRSQHKAMVVSLRDGSYDQILETPPPARPSKPSAVNVPAAGAAPPRPSRPSAASMQRASAPELPAQQPPPPRPAFESVSELHSNTLPIGTAVPIEVLEAAAADADNAFYREIHAAPAEAARPMLPPRAGVRRATPHQGGTPNTGSSPPTDSGAGTYRFIGRSSRSNVPSGSPVPADVRPPFGASVWTERTLDQVMLDFLAGGERPAG